MFMFQLKSKLLTVDEISIIEPIYITAYLPIVRRREKNSGQNIDHNVVHRFN